MKISIPSLYAEYGRYISRFRSIQFYIDCLTPVEKRLLLAIHNLASKGKVKSARIIGETIGKYHPHGDISTYGSLVQLIRRGFVNGHSNFGHDNGYESVSPAAMRYTEVSSNKQLDKTISELLHFVPWSDPEGMNEDCIEYISTIVPLGLVGDGFHFGITFYSSTVPRYKFEDLCKRLKHLLDSGDPKQNIIIPNISNCKITETNLGDYLNILQVGKGSITIIPKTKLRAKEIEILGKAPGGGFTSLVKKGFRPSEKNKAGKELGNPTGEYSLVDVSNSKGTLVTVEPRRGIKIKALYPKIVKYVSKSISALVNVVNEEGKVQCCGIDSILEYNYQIYVQTSKLKLEVQLSGLQSQRFEFEVIAIIRDIFERHKCHKVDDIVKHWKISKVVQGYTEEDIRSVASKKSIKQLIEQKLDIAAIDKKIKSVSKDIKNINKICYDKLSDSV